MKNRTALCCRLAVVFTMLLIASCGKQPSLQNAAIDVATAATERSNPSGFHPPMLLTQPPLPQTARAPLTPEEEAKRQAQMDQLVEKLNVRLKVAKKSESWAPPKEIQLAIESAARGAIIKRTGCANDFCRYVVIAEDRHSREEFGRTFSVEGSILFDYSRDNPKEVVAYVFKPDADLRSL